jgi:hypothetical protein
MSSNRLSGDTCAYKKNLAQSTGPLSYNLDNHFSINADDSQNKITGLEDKMQKGDNCTNAVSAEKFNLYNETRLTDDPCEVGTDEKQSIGPGNYMVSNHFSCTCHIPEIKKVALGQPNIFFKDGYGNVGRDGCKVDEDSKTKHGQLLTSYRHRQQLFTRTFNTVPYMGRGLGNPCIEGNLLAGEDTSARRPCNTLSEVHHSNQFNPLHRWISEGIQDPIHIMEEANDKSWIRGGIPSRQTVKNINYKDNCLNYMKDKHFRTRK